jgi:hypothetical protein
MVVSITWSSTASGTTPVTDAVYHGVIAAGGPDGAAQDLYISHDGLNSITNCGFYIQAYNGGGYTGTVSPAADFTEIVGWGDAATGGVVLNQDFQGGFPGGSETLHTTAAGIAATPIALSVNAGDPAPLATAQEITPAPAEEAHIQLKFRVPAATAAGRRFVDHCLRFDYTS